MARLGQFSFSQPPADFGRTFPLVSQRAGGGQRLWRFQAVLHRRIDKSLSTRAPNQPEGEEPHPDVTFLTPKALSSLVASHHLKDNILKRCQQAVHMVSASLLHCSLVHQRN